jgi:hypothetical protein
MAARITALLAVTIVSALTACAGPALSPGGLVDGGHSYTSHSTTSGSGASYNWLEGGGG